MLKAKRILVGLKSAENAVELTDAACRVGAKSASLLLIHVLELPDATPLDAEVPDLIAEAQKLLRRCERVAKRSRMKVASLILRARSAGPALLDEMKERKIDLAVLGYHHGHTVGEVFFGTTHNYLAHKAPCEMMMWIPRKK